MLRKIFSRFFNETFTMLASRSNLAVRCWNALSKLPALKTSGSRIDTQRNVPLASRFRQSLSRFSTFGEQSASFSRRSTPEDEKSAINGQESAGEQKMSEQQRKAVEFSAEDQKLLVEFKTEREKLLQAVKDLDDRYKRALAETENVRTRMLRQIEETKTFAIQNFCKDLLEIADILELAKESLPQDSLNGSDESTKRFKQFYDGVIMMQTNLHKIFNRNGLVQSNPLGEKFNPNVHEAVFEVDDPKKEPGTIGVVVKTGYLLNDRPIRPAKVGIVKAK